MRTIYDKDTHAELHERLDKLTAGAERQWGKMSASQAMEHTARAIEMASGAKPLEQHFLGKAIGWIFKGRFLGEQPFSKNSPTGPTLIIQDEPDFDATRARLKQLMTEFHEKGPSASDGNVHGFFGPLTGDEWGICQYKHVDHHLRQFGV
ncbi:MAG: DUF1569 domain-containing protein [Acidobacteria bacterium]|nr:DUF1569 domain-containing protein [Acidobacteriota bacterium]